MLNVTLLLTYLAHQSQCVKDHMTPLDEMTYDECTFPKEYCNPRTGLCEECSTKCEHQDAKIPLACIALCRGEEIVKNLTATGHPQNVTESLGEEIVKNFTAVSNAKNVTESTVLEKSNGTNQEYTTTAATMSEDPQNTSDQSSTTLGLVLGLTVACVILCVLIWIFRRNLHVLCSKRSTPDNGKTKSLSYRFYKKNTTFCNNAFEDNATQRQGGEYPLSGTLQEETESLLVSDQNLGNIPGKSTTNNVMLTDVGIQTTQTLRFVENDVEMLSEKTARVAPMVTAKTHESSGEVTVFHPSREPGATFAIEIETEPPEVQTEEEKLIQGRNNGCHQRKSKQMQLSLSCVPAHSGPNTKMVIPRPSTSQGPNRREIGPWKAFAYLRSELLGRDWKQFFRELYDETGIQIKADNALKEAQFQYPNEAKEHVYHMLNQWWTRCNGQVQEKQDILLTFIQGQEEFRELAEETERLMKNGQTETNDQTRQLKYLYCPMYASASTSYVFPAEEFRLPGYSNQNSNSTVISATIPEIEFPADSETSPESQVYQNPQTIVTIETIQSQLSTGTFINDDFQRLMLNLLSSDLRIKETDLINLRISDVTLNPVDIEGTQVFVISLDTITGGNCPYGLINKNTFKYISAFLELRKNTSNDWNSKLFNVELNSTAKNQQNEENGQPMDSETTPLPETRCNHIGKRKKVVGTKRLSHRHGRRYFSIAQAKDIKNAFMDYIKRRSIRAQDVRNELENRPYLRCQLDVADPKRQDDATKRVIKRITDRVWTFIKQERKAKY